MTVELRLLDDRADTAQRCRALPRDGHPEQAHGSGIGTCQAEQHSNDCRLAGPVVPKEAERASGWHSQLNALNCSTCAETLRESNGFDREYTPWLGLVDH